MGVEGENVEFEGKLTKGHSVHFILMADLGQDALFGAYFYNACTGIESSANTTGLVKLKPTCDFIQHYNLFTLMDV